MVLKTKPLLCMLIGVLTALAAATAGISAELLRDDYRAMTPGMISPGVVGVQSEYHYLAQSQPKGNWVVSAFRRDLSQRAWRLIEEDGQRLIWQSYTENRVSDRAFTHPMLVAGDALPPSSIAWETSMLNELRRLSMNSCSWRPVDCSVQSPLAIG